MPKTPEQWLEECSPAAKKGGLFKLFLGYAPGVGKTYTMLTEAIRRHTRGEDVVIGVVETHGRKTVGELVTKSGSRAAQSDRVQGRGFRRDGCGRHSRAQALRRAGGRTGAHQHRGQQTSQALRRCAGAAGCGNRCSLHHEHPAPGERDPDGAGSHRASRCGKPFPTGCCKESTKW